MTNISSRTPEGQPNTCPVCGKQVEIEPSLPTGDAPCPHCGCLLWFESTNQGVFFFEKDAAGRPSGLFPIFPGVQGKDAVPAIRPGDRVRIVEGVFKGYEARLDQIDPASSEAVLSIDIFGRETPLVMPAWLLELA